MNDWDGGSVRNTRSQAVTQCRIHRCHTKRGSKGGVTTRDPVVALRVTVLKSEVSKVTVN